MPSNKTASAKTNTTNVVSFQKPLTAAECSHIRPFSWILFQDDDGAQRTLLLLERFRPGDTTLLVADVTEPEAGIWCEPKHVLKDLGLVNHIAARTQYADKVKVSEAKPPIQAGGPNVSENDIMDMIAEFTDPKVMLSSRQSNKLLNDMVRGIVNLKTGFDVTFTAPHATHGRREVSYYVDGATPEDLEYAACHIVSVLHDFTYAVVVSRKAIRVMFTADAA